jgi:hypothetical protein
MICKSGDFGQKYSKSGQLKKNIASKGSLKSLKIDKKDADRLEIQIYCLWMSKSVSYLFIIFQPSHSIQWET